MLVSAKKTILKFTGFALSAGLLAGMLGGCAGTDNAMKPTPLSKVAPTVIGTDLLWRMGGGVGADGQYLVLRPAISHHTVIVVNSDGVVAAFNAIDGAPLWRVHLNFDLSSSPTVHDGKVFIGSREGDVLCLSAQNGKLLWHHAVSSEILAAPTVADGKVIVHTHDAHVFALDAKTGKQLWVYDGTAPTLSLEANSQPAEAHGAVLLGTASGQLLALSLSKGQALWQRPIAMPQGSNAVENMVDVDAQPIIKNGMIYAVALHGYLVAVDLKNGNVLWQHQLSSYQNMAYANGTLVVTTDTGEVKAFDANNGKLLWTQDKLMYRLITAPAIYQGKYVVVADYAGFVHFLSIQNGQLLARVKVDKVPIRAQPKVAGSRVFVVSIDGRLSALMPTA